MVSGAVRTRDCDGNMLKLLSLWRCQSIGKSDRWSKNWTIRRARAATFRQVATLLQRIQGTSTQVATWGSAMVSGSLAPRADNDNFVDTPKSQDCNRLQALQLQNDGRTRSMSHHSLLQLAKLQICPEQDLTLEQVHHVVQQAMRQEASPEGDGMLLWNWMIQSPNASAYGIVACWSKIIAATADCIAQGLSNLWRPVHQCRGRNVQPESQELSFCMSQLIGDTRRTGGMVEQSGTTHLVSVTGDATIHPMGSSPQGMSGRWYCHESPQI